ncbi:nuclear-pore anchor [Dorcoceras hygrometricum]|uniref:Nuclear-pore anchor n=1 Tax=Dorcoceras hygrometricum TaxID=472368 RepID=A0A2Z7D388_9LAMI|nr:nuclear-pore anchor [Dorcoceras hygrometricum]
MTSAFLLEEAVIRKYDVSLISRQLDGSAMMMSVVMSSQSAVGKTRRKLQCFYNQTQATVLHMIRRKNSNVASYSTTSRWYLTLAIAKRCRLDKWIRQRFAFALRFSRWILITSRRCASRRIGRSAKTKLHLLLRVYVNEPAAGMNQLLEVNESVVEQIVGIHSAVGMQSTLKMERMNG